jgi:polar amino acid transport system substrate-binding protein
MGVASNIIGFSLLAGCIALRAAHAQAIEFGSENVPPYSTLQDGKPGGPLTDIVQAVCRHIDMPCVISALPKRRLEAIMEAGKTQGQYPLARTPEREALYYFEAPVINTEYAFYTVKGRGFRYSAPPDLANRTIVAYGPSGTSQTLKNLLTNVPSARIQLEIDNPTLLRKLAAGRYTQDGIVMLNREVAEHLQAHQRIENIEFAGVATKVQYYIGLSKRTTPPEVARRFFDGFDAVVQSGELREILRHYQLESKMIHEPHGVK